MKDSNENRLIHLQMIQGVINRLASNSNTLKEWTVAVGTTLFTLAVLSQASEIAFVALFPTLVFWGLDAYYLRQERLFRNLYKAVHQTTEESPVEPLTMDVRPYETPSDGFIRVWFRPPLSVFHGAIFLAVVAVALLLNI